jgi:hypothetical protein
MRTLCAAIPARRPAACTNQLAPRRLRVPDRQLRAAELGTLQLYSSNTSRGTNPEPQKTENTQLLIAPITEEGAQYNNLAVLITGESARATATNARGKCPGAALSRGIRAYSAAPGSLQAARGNPGAPTAGSPIRRTPVAPFSPEGAIRTPQPIRLSRRPAAKGTARPRIRPVRADGETPPGQRQRAPPARECPRETSVGRPAATARWT